MLKFYFYYIKNENYYFYYIKICVATLEEMSEKQENVLTIFLA